MKKSSKKFRNNNKKMKPCGNKCRYNDKLLQKNENRRRNKAKQI